MQRAQAARDALTSDALNTLVHQFSDPLCFYRELIQNSLDAGSWVVDIRCEYEDGVATLSVSDSGEGMNRHIIDSQLTRLFSSNKENDLTKIGKFGVGFVSVFAIEPDAVVVDTSRDGENWRVLFSPDRSFVRVALDQPIGGTVVRLLKSMTASAFEDLVARSREVIRYWCRYAEARILFQGDTMNEPFDVQADIKTSYSEPGTDVVIGLVADNAPHFGFYNRGLTLLEGRKAIFPHVTFRLKSRYLEHTISRDNVMQDENYQKALGVVRRGVYGHLYTELLGRLENGEHHLLNLAVGLLREGSHRPPGIMGRKIFPVFAGASISGARLKKIRKKRGAVYYARSLDRIPAALMQRKTVVLQAHDAEVLSAAVRACLGEQPYDANLAFYMPEIPPLRSRPGHIKALEKALCALLWAAGMPAWKVAVANFHYPGSVITGRLSVWHPDPRYPAPMPPPIPRVGGDGRWYHLLLNQQHELIQSIAEAAKRDAALAAHTLAQILVAALEIAPIAPDTLLLRTLGTRALRSA